MLQQLAYQGVGPGSRWRMKKWDLSGNHSAFCSRRVIKCFLFLSRVHAVHVHVHVGRLVDWSVCLGYFSIIALLIILMINLRHWRSLIYNIKHATVHTSLSIRPLVTLFFHDFFFGPHCSCPNGRKNLKYGPCPPARDFGSRVSGLVFFRDYFQSSRAQIGFRLNTTWKFIKRSSSLLAYVQRYQLRF